MIKTYTTNTFNPTTTTVKLTKDAIVIVERNGESMQNEYGGYPALHVGSEEYLRKKWNSF